jgi:hypothetical protein
MSGLRTAGALAAELIRTSRVAGAPFDFRRRSPSDGCDVAEPALSADLICADHPAKQPLRVAGTLLRFQQSPQSIHLWLDGSVRSHQLHP